MQQAMDLIKGLGQLKGPAGEMLQSQFAAKYGLDFESLKKLLSPDFDPQHELNIAARMGVDFNKATEGAHQLNLALLDFYDTLDLMSKSAASKIFEQYGDDI